MVLIKKKTGLTTLELLLSFILMMIIVIGMFRIVFNYKEKGRILAINNQLNTYKSMVTKFLNDEMALKKDIYAKYIKNCTYADTPDADFEGVTCIDLFDYEDDQYRKRLIIASNKIVFGDFQGGVLSNERKFPFPNAETSVTSSSVKVQGVYTVLTLVLSNSTANNVQSTIVVYAKTSTQGPIAEIVLSKIPDDQLIDDTDETETFIRGEMPNNYVWYSGRMWRVVSILSDGSAKLVTNDNMTDIVYNTTSARNFAGSYGYTWLNNVFYPTLKNKESYIQTYSWNATYRANADKAVKPPTTTMVSANVGMLNTYEYYKTFLDGLSYLNISKHWRTLTPSPAQNYDGADRPSTYVIDHTNTIKYKRAYLATGIRPAIVINANVQIVTGDGTMENPYCFASDYIAKASDLINNPLNTRTTGEYVSFANNLWRVIETNNGKTKIMMVNPLSSKMKFSNGGNAPTYGTGVTIGLYLINTWYGTLNPKDKFMIVLGPWSLTTMGATAQYPAGNANLVDLMVGMPRMGEMFATSSTNSSGTVYTLTPRNSTDVWYLHEQGYAKYAKTDANSFYPRAALYLSPDVYITGGTGLPDDPFTVDISYEEAYDVSPNEPILADGMIPIKYDNTNNRWVKANSSNPNYDWYNYAGKRWANAVMVTTDTRASYQNASVGTEVLESDILAYFVWIPRYKYRSFNPTFVTQTSQATSPQLIDLEFESGTSTTGTSSSLFRLYTHPAFTFGDTELTGFWVAKFESSAPINSACQKNMTTSDCKVNERYITVKPNQKSSIYSNINVAYRTSQNMMTSFYLNSSNGVDIHLMKNLEWGAVAYLTMSRYGKGSDPYGNNSTSYYTGRSSGGATTTSANGTYSYDGFTCTTAACTSGTRDETTKQLAGGASTTGNIYGVYDMVGGAWDYVTGNYNKTTAEGGINVTRHPLKYFDIYTGSTITASKIGDAIGEAEGWYPRYVSYATSSAPWYERGGKSVDVGSTASIFAFAAVNGDAHSARSFRPTIAITSVAPGSTTMGYVTDGLVLHFDGINNTGIGHSDSLAVWKNLAPGASITSSFDTMGIYVKGNFDLSTPGSTGNSGWYPDSLQFDGVDDYLMFKTLYKYSRPTLEMVVSYYDTAKGDVFNNYQSGGIGFNKGTNRFQVYISSDWRYVNGSSVVPNKIYALSGKYDGSYLYLYENGVKYQTSRTGNITYNSTAPLAMACNPSAAGDCGSFIKVRVYSIRLYNRALTEEEVLQNYNVDKVRFGIE